MEIKALMAVAAFLTTASPARAASINEKPVVLMEVGDHADRSVQNVENVPAPKPDALWSLSRAAASVGRNSGGMSGAGGTSGNLASFTFDEQYRSDNDVVIDLQTIVSTTGPKFVGVTLDASIFRRFWKDVDVYSKPLHALAQGLAPSFFRVGGTAADFFIFDPTSTVKEDSVAADEDQYDYHGYDYDYDYDLPGPVNPAIKNYTVTGDEWERLNYLVQVAGWDLIFDVNEFLRQDNKWDGDNARKLLTFSQKRNYTIPCFQLGNEPNAYYHNFHFSIPASQLASDMQRLRSLLSEFPLYHNSCIIGPDVTKVTRGSAKQYLEEFLKTGGQTVVAAATLHHYYFNAKDKGASLSDFINTTILDTLDQELSIGTSTTHSLAPKLPVWLTETSSVSGGGLPGVSDAYAAGFMWLDKLGLSAKYGLQAVLRQSFYHGEYPLIAEDFTPYPDYFLTLLYKRLVQGHVLNVSTSTDNVRIYASCANPSLYPKGALTVYALNVRAVATTLNFTQFPGQKYDLYILTPGDEHGLRSAFSALNGKKLVLINDKLPPLPPLVHSGPVTFPPYSFGFVVIPNAQVELCKSWNGWGRDCSAHQVLPMTWIIILRIPCVADKWQGDKIHNLQDSLTG